MKRRRFLEGVSVGTAASLAGCPGRAERVETRQTEEPEATGSDPATPEETTTETKEGSSDTAWTDYDGLTKLIPEVKRGDDLAIIPGEKRPDYGLEQDPHTWWQIDYQPKSYEQSKMTEDDVGALKNKETVERGEVTKINGEPLHVVGGNHKYKEQDEWTSLLDTNNVHSKRALGIVRAAQKGEGIKITNIDTEDIEETRSGVPDAMGVISGYDSILEKKVISFDFLYEKEGDDGVYTETADIWDPTYDEQGAITEAKTGGDGTITGGEFSWDYALDVMVEDP
jgi:hypothetical protein